MKIGIDFGSTYSTVARYNPVTDNVEAMTLAEGEPASIPSVVSVNKRGQITCGFGAKAQTGKRSVRIFEAFKMLLTEKNQDMLSRRGYDDQFTPKAVASAYLKYMVDGASNRLNDEPVESVVICVPEIWCERYETIDGRPILRDILINDVGIPAEGVQVVTEPEAASAYFAYNYERETRHSFNGHLLLIDYGGGTLDITLTQVFSHNKGAMEIGYREGGGAGENHPQEGSGGVIGSAGIAFMQDVVISAIESAGLEPPENFTDPDFLTALRDLESQLKSAERINEIEETFEEYGSYKRIARILDEEPIDFIYLEYGVEDVPVTYQQLYRSYRKIIEPVLSKTVSEMNKKVFDKIKSDPCSPDAGRNDDFKIALVGGFGSFYLVKKQIADIYNLDPDSRTDPRTKHISEDKREQAISLGAALIAAKKVILQKVSQFAIGFCLPEGGRIRAIHYAIPYHQILEQDKIYFPLRSDGSPVDYTFISINRFAIEFSDCTDRCMPITPKSEILDRLRNLPREGRWNCGFSMDNDGTLSLHLVQSTARYGGAHIVIPLERLHRMFEMTVAEEKRVGDIIE